MQVEFKIPTTTVWLTILDRRGEPFKETALHSFPNIPAKGDAFTATLSDVSIIGEVKERRWDYDEKQDRLVAHITVQAEKIS